MSLVRIFCNRGSQEVTISPLMGFITVTDLTHVCVLLCVMWEVKADIDTDQITGEFKWQWGFP